MRKKRFHRRRIPPEKYPKKKYIKKMDRENLLLSPTNGWGLPPLPPPTPCTYSPCHWNAYKSTKEYFILQTDINSLKSELNERVSNIVGNRLSRYFITIPSRGEGGGGGERERDGQILQSHRRLIERSCVELYKHKNVGRCLVGAMQQRHSCRLPIDWFKFDIFYKSIVWKMMKNIFG